VLQGYTYLGLVSKVMSVGGIGLDVVKVEGQCSCTLLVVTCRYSKYLRGSTSSV
jgi:hypothetical protein